MTFQVDLTQKKNGTFIAGAHAADPAGAEQQPQVNSYKDAASFRAALKVASLQDHAEAALQEASAEAERRTETQVTLEVDDVEPEQLRRIGLN